MSQNPTTRRQFLRTAAGGVGAAWAMSASSYARVMGANARLNVAYIGVGGIASSQHIPILEQLGAGCTCYTDADESRFGACATRWSEAVGYTDYRRMYDKHMAEIDAVMVGTPDHHHYPATIIAMMEKKHAYTQKPLTHTIWEARQLALAHKKYKVATQMGNQMHATHNLRLTIDYLLGGAIGDLREAHIWTNRPVWPQSRSRPAGEHPVPEGLNWDAWIGPAKMRPFLEREYHPFAWRGWWEFGTGALGDMACHEVDAVYWAMQPGSPSSIELVDGYAFREAESFNQNTSVKFVFPDRGTKRGFDLYWHDGGNKPPRPEELPEGQDLTAEGALYIGTRGKMIAMPNAKSPPKLLPESKHADFGPPPQMIERSEDGHHGEWYRACIGEKPFDHPKGNFAYSGPFTETILLGCIAQRLGGKHEFDGENLRFPNSPEATALISKEYREGWDFRM